MPSFATDNPTLGLTPYPVGTPRVRFPFANTPSADVYARTIERDFKVRSDYFDATRRLATRTSYTNYHGYSELSQNAYWNYKQYLTPADNTVANPMDGQLTAGTLTETADTGAHYIGRSSVVIGAGATICYSRFLKAGTSAFVQLLVDGGGDGFYANFDLSSGVVSVACTAFSTGTAIASGIIPAGGGWYRCYIVGNLAPADTVAAPYTLLIDSATAGLTPSYLGSVSKYLYYYGANFEIGVSMPGPHVSTTSAARTVSCPDVDGIVNSGSYLADPFAYLIGETDPAPSGLALLAGYTRLYARIPAPQTNYGSRLIARPIMHDIKSGTAYAVSFDKGSTSHVFTSRKTVISAATVPSRTIAAPLPSGNITFVEGAHTLNLPANSSAAATIAAFNSTLTGLTNVSANATNGSLSISWMGTMTTITAPSGVIYDSVFSYYSWATFRTTGTVTIPDSRVVNVTSHGASAGHRIAVYNGDAIIGMGVVSIVLDANNFSMLISDLSQPDSLITHCVFAPQAAACYVNGPVSCTTKEVQAFYLPGFTSGIASVADIPLVATKTDPISWLAAIIAATAYVEIEGSQLDHWLGSSIYQQTTIYAQMSDALDTVTP